MATSSTSGYAASHESGRRITILISMTMLRRRSDSGHRALRTPSDQHHNLGGERAG